MKKTHYKKQDIEKYEKLLNEHKNYRTDGLIITFDKKDPLIKELQDFNFAPLFCWLIDTKRPDLIKYLPYNIKILSTENKQFPNNEWTIKDGFLGLNSGTKLKLFIPIHKKIHAIKIIWLLLHEFRHKIQYLNPSIGSLVSDKNKNKKRFFEFIEKEFKVDRNTVNHVFHEIDPAEVDANIFACDMLEIKTLGSPKFDITDDTLEHLTCEKQNKSQRKIIYGVMNNEKYGGYMSFFEKEEDAENEIINQYKRLTEHEIGYVDLTLEKDRIIQNKENLYVIHPIVLQ